MTAPRRFFAELHREEPILSLTGWSHVILLFLMLMAAPWDQRQIVGLNPWVKPMKFAASIAIYVWTIGWFLRYLPGLTRLKRIVRYGVPAVMFSEIALITLQAARGVRSHFNTDTATDGFIFNLMGLLILVNTFFAIALFIQFLWQEVALPPAYLTGIRLGFALFIFGSLEGVVMALNMGHSVGVADGGPGLPVLNWSSQGGDLRAAHAVGLHALQVLPLAGYGVSRWLKTSPRLMQVAVVMLAGFLYLGLFSWLFREAIAGRPLLRA
jgi:hypothetical protein